MLWLPKYAAHEVNPAERIWGLMKGKVAANRLAGNIDLLVAQAPLLSGVVSPSSGLAPGGLISMPFSYTHA